MEEKGIKVLVLGDEGVGKTSLMRTIAEGSFPTADSLDTPSPEGGSVYTSTKDNSITVCGTSYMLEFTDRSSDVDVKASIDKVDCCYLCFDISSPASFKRVKLKWLPLLTPRKSPLTVILVGLKHDLCQDRGTILKLSAEGHEPIASNVAQNLADEIKAVKYVEVSALKYIGIQELKEKTVFEFVEREMKTQERSEKRRCVVM